MSININVNADGTGDDFWMWVNATTARRSDEIVDLLDAHPVLCRTREEMTIAIVGAVMGAATMAGMCGHVASLTIRVRPDGGRRVVESKVLDDVTNAGVDKVRQAILANIPRAI
jgi:hypothetical protein